MRLEEQSKMKDNKQWRIPFSLGRWYRVTAGHAVVLNVIFLSCFLFAAVYRLHVKVEPEVKILYGEAHTGNGGQLFYTYRDREFSGDYFQGETGSGEELKEMSFLLSDLDWGEMSYRLDLLLEEDAFTISRIFITYEDEILLEIKKGDLEQYIAKLDACEYGSTSGRFHVLSGVPSLYFNDYFSESLYEVTDRIVKTEQLERISGANWNLLRIAFLSYFILFIFWFCGRHDPDEKGLSAQNTKSAGWKSVIAMVAAVILVWNFVLVLCVFFSQNIESILNPKALPAKPG